MYLVHTTYLHITYDNLKKCTQGFLKKGTPSILFVNHKHFENNIWYMILDDFK